MTMLRHTLVLGLAAVTWAGSAAVAAAQSDLETVTVAFSDPSRPGRLRLSQLTGGIAVIGENRKDVSIEARSGPPRASRARRADAAPPGLRRLNPTPGFTVDEQDNEMKIGSAGFVRRTDFTIRVPARTHLKLATVNNGTISVEGVEGDLEVNNVNGPVTLTNVSGSVVAHSLNGLVKATLTRVTAQKVMAFTSFNGAVDVTLPPTVKANLRLRSDNGDVFTDFDVQLRGPTSGLAQSRRNGGRLRIEVNSALFGSINGGGPEIELRTFNGSVFVRKGP